jgi:hypothetical protein
MRLELAERLRCPRAHEPSPLVIVAQEVVERDLRRAVAGCPLCGFEATIRDGDAYLDGGPVPAETPRDAARPEAGTDELRAEREQLDRLIALLGLGEPEGHVLLTGQYARFAASLSTETGVSVVTTHAALEVDRGGAEAEVSALVLAALRVPLSDHSFRAAAVDSLDPAFLADAARTLVVGGRLVAPASAPLPPNVRELARDPAEWVAEREAGSGGVVPLRRA